MFIAGFAHDLKKIELHKRVVFCREMYNWGAKWLPMNVSACKALSSLLGAVGKLFDVNLFKLNRILYKI